MNNQQIIRKISLFAIAVLFVVITNAQAWGQQVLVGYDLTGNNTANATFAPTTTAANVNSSSLTRGSTAAASSANNSFRTTGFQNNGISVANTDYFQSTISSPGNRISLSSLTANLNGTPTFAAGTGVISQFAYSLDGTPFTLIGSPQTIAGNPQSLTVDLTGVTALQNIVAGTTVTFRYYASGQTTTGGWGFFSAASGTNGFAINGTVETAPAFTSANATTFTVGQAGTFAVTTSGSPTVTSITQTGTLPTGVTFTDNGNGTATLAGTPATGTNGTYNLVFTAVNGVNPDATQNFTLTIALAPSAAPATVGGRVIQQNGNGIRSALVTMIDSQGIERTAYTDRQGNYTFEGVPSGLVYVFSVAHLRYQFDQPTQVQFIGEETDGINFVGTSFTRFGDLWTVRSPLSKEQ